MSDQYAEDHDAPESFVPSTSLAAYAMMRETGQDRTNQYRVYRFIGWAQDDVRFHGGISRANVKMAFRDVKDSFAPRMAELRRMGLIYRSHEKPNDAHNDGVQPMMVMANRTTGRSVPLKLAHQPKEYILVVRMPTSCDTPVIAFEQPLLNMEEVALAASDLVATGAMQTDLAILRVWHGGRRDCIPCDIPLETITAKLRQRDLF